MRYKFYREHKFVSAAVNDVERLIATADFTNPAAAQEVKTAFGGLLGLLSGHAHYENETLHALLKARGSAVFAQVEQDHEQYKTQLADLELRLSKAIASTTTEEQVELGYQFYLWFRKFAGDNLLHLHEEETVILPELQRLYSDEELSKVEFKHYRLMSPGDMVHMLQALFPYMNPADHEVFLTDLHRCDPAKFNIAWPDIRPLLSPVAANHFEKNIA